MSTAQLERTQTLRTRVTSQTVISSTHNPLASIPSFTPGFLLHTPSARQILDGILHYSPSSLPLPRIPNLLDNFYIRTHPSSLSHIDPNTHPPTASIQRASLPKNRISTPTHPTYDHTKLDINTPPLRRNRMGKTRRVVDTLSSWQKWI